MENHDGQEFWQMHLEAWHRSDLTQKDYCLCEPWTRRENILSVAP